MTIGAVARLPAASHAGTKEPSNHLPDASGSVHYLSTPASLTPRGRFGEPEHLEQTLTKALSELDTTSPAEPLGERLHEVGEMLASLAERYVRRGDSARAEVLYLRAIQVLREALPSDHPLLALSRDNLAGLYKARRQYALAESLQRTALADLQRYYARPHADIAIAMCNLADTCLLTGRSADARHLLSESIEMLRGLFGEEDSRMRDLIKHYENALRRYSQSLTPAV